MYDDNEKHLIETAKAHPLWSRFVKWALNHSIDLDYTDDWGIWWICFMAGAIASL